MGFGYLPGGPGAARRSAAGLAGRPAFMLGEELGVPQRKVEEHGVAGRIETAGVSAVPRRITQQFLCPIMSRRRRWRGHRPLRRGRWPRGGRGSPGAFGPAGRRRTAVVRCPPPRKWSTANLLSGPAMRVACLRHSRHTPPRGPGRPAAGRSRRFRPGYCWNAWPAATESAAENTPTRNTARSCGPAPGSHAAPDDVACSHRWFHPTPRGVAGSDPHRQPARSSGCCWVPAARPADRSRSCSRTSRSLGVPTEGGADRCGAAWPRRWRITCPAYRGPVVTAPVAAFRCLRPLPRQNECCCHSRGFGSPVG